MSATAVTLGATRSSRTSSAVRAGGGGVDGPTPIDLLLRRQAEPTPVERFADLHESDGLPAGARWWRDRLPASGPGEGEQYAFAVDLDACTGCQACVAACTGLNGLDPGEQWRRVSTVHGTAADGPAVLTVTAACHHCLEPACLAGCPVDAYEKDPVTGIVAHLDDQCIGCSYCTLTCPYEVPAYHHGLGIVRKCDLCRGRLAEGEAPACVQGCPTGAITVTLVDTAELRRELAAAVVAADAGRSPRPSVAPGAPDSGLTVPTTRYRSARRRVDGASYVDHRVVRPGHGHTPLAVMLVFTQVAVGTSVLGVVLDLIGRHQVPDAVPALALAVAVAALGASLGHLGRPHLAHRAVIGFRHSWLSREIVAFGAFAAIAVGRAGLAPLDAPEPLEAAVAAAAGLAGLAGVGCSVMLYAVTRRPWWRARTSALRFGTTTFGSGALTVAAVTLAWPPGPDAVATARGLLVFAAAVTVAGLAAQAAVLRPRAGSDIAATRRLLLGPLSDLLQLRLLAAGIGGVVVPLGAAASLRTGSPTATSAAVTTVALVVSIVGELTERRLFFLASVAPGPVGIPEGGLA